MSYATWMAFAVPLMLVNLILAWLLILVIMRITSGPAGESKEKSQKIKKIILNRKKALGPISIHEIQVVVLFMILILLWFFQSPKFMKGWADSPAFTGETQRDPPTKLKISSATPACFIVALAFILRRTYDPDAPSEALINWHTVEKKLPWGVILLLGGGFALADITKKSGLSEYMVLQLEGLNVRLIMIV